MKKVTLRGGLGNQMFQYARARARAGTKRLTLNIYELEHPASGDTPRSLALNDFSLGPIEIIRKPSTFLKKIFDRCMRLMQPDWGYFQSEDYFLPHEMLIRKEFTLQDSLQGDAEALTQKIKETKNAVSLHVRRGDYVNNPQVLRDFGVCSLAYYESAMTYIRERVSNPVFFVFSDDIPWVKANLPVGDNTVFVQGSGLTDKIELSLMSQCMHNIIANSSFSWWGAWLNPNPDKIVIAPTPWFNQTPYNKRIIPESWTQIPK